MVEKTFTVTTRLEYSQDVWKYYGEYIAFWSMVERYVWHRMADPGFSRKYKSKASFVTEVMDKFHILKRTVNSIVFDVSGKIKALKELKKLEISSMQTKLSQVESKITKAESYIDTRKPLAKANALSAKDMRSYRQMKTKLYWLKNKANRMRQEIAKRQSDLESGILKMGFGGKKMFQKQFHLKENGYKSHKAWYKDYTARRDSHVFYMGSSDETLGNQMFQTSAVMVQGNGKAPQMFFSSTVRKENKWADDGKTITLPPYTIGYMGDQVYSSLLSHSRNALHSVPLSYRILRNGKKLYLQVIFRITVPMWETMSAYGVIGLDYNDGFIEVTETDRHGNIVKQQHYALRYHGTGNKADSEVKETTAKIVKWASQTGKDIAIEDLNFTKTKAKTIKAKSAKGKKYNKMIHAFDYSRYKDAFANACHRQHIGLHLVNPANTSKIGDRKYAKTRKLTVHQAASYVIARRAQGYKDTL